MFRTQYNYKPGVDDSEFHSGDSMTVPHDAYTVRELFQRFKSGLVPDISKDVYYDYDMNDDSVFDVDDPSMYLDHDLSDIDERRLRLSEVRSRLRLPDPPVSDPPASESSEAPQAE